ncbi:MAG TPA: ADP-heptose--LPS heptosyltransferase [Candidatus Binatia bacterium]|nr:ADP-heptose--LPS heptosyltransferase [Candidatus Binatia bacterium]
MNKFAFPPDMGQRWMLHMRRGDFATAWQLSDIVLRARRAIRCEHLPRHLQWIWDGRSLEGKRVVIRCYHGLGDTVHFIRYAPLVRAMAAEVTVLAQSELLPLLSWVSGIDRLFPLERGETGLDYDVDVEVMELPHVFRTTLESIPAQIPYIDPSNAVDGDVQLPFLDLRSWRSERERSGGAGARLVRDKLTVGIVWAAGDWDPRRSIPISLLAPLANVAGVELQIFQVGAALTEPREWHAIIPRWNDIVMEAMLIRDLDLMISIDSLPAHLAGALGVPVWTLLQKEADWRWMERRNDSPWYPTMRLFRQERPGEWPPVIAAVANELAKVTSARSATPFTSQLSTFSPQRSAADILAR